MPAFERVDNMNSPGRASRGRLCYLRDLHLVRWIEFDNFSLRVPIDLLVGDSAKA